MVKKLIVVIGRLRCESSMTLIRTYAGIAHQNTFQIEIVVVDYVRI
jgi:hypothetical protein